MAANIGFADEGGTGFAFLEVLRGSFRHRILEGYLLLWTGGPSCGATRWSELVAVPICGSTLQKLRDIPEKKAASAHFLI